MTPKQIHKQFLRRQGIYERKYARLFRAVLRKQYLEAAEQYPTPYTVNPDDYKPVLIKLYTEVLPREAEQAWNDFVKPLAKDRKSSVKHISIEKKDFFDDLMSILGNSIPDGEWIRIWRDTAREWLNINILTKIQGMAQTTMRAIAKVVEDNLNADQSSIDTIRRSIQEASNGEVNKQRATLIARTETMQAMNKGRRLSMFSSGLEWQKKWLDTPDNRTRLSHRKIATEEYRLLDEPYWLVSKDRVMEPCQHPGDPQLSAENVINCRCTEMYEVVRDAAGRPIKRNDRPISSYSEII